MTSTRIESVERGVEICKKDGIDVILAVGGGSTIDCCKAVATGVYWEGDLWDMVATRHGQLKALPLVAILTPRWMRHILAKDPTSLPRFVKFARNVMGLDGQDELALAHEAIDALEAYFKSTGIPMTLTELGIDREHFADMAAGAKRGGKLEGAFVPLPDEDIIQIYEACL